MYAHFLRFTISGDFVFLKKLSSINFVPKRVKLVYLFVIFTNGVGINKTRKIFFIKHLLKNTLFKLFFLFF